MSHYSPVRGRQFLSFGETLILGFLSRSRGNFIRTSGPIVKGIFHDGCSGGPSVREINRVFKYSVRRGPIEGSAD